MPKVSDGRKQADFGQQHRDAMAARSRANQSAAAEIGSIPPVADPQRRIACGTSLLLYLTTYFPQSTGLFPFSDDHKRVIARIEQCIMHGGRFVNSVYRGFAKTTISERAALWAISYGHRHFVAIFGAEATLSGLIIESIRGELEDNDLLAEDFPEICYPVQMLEGKVQRCASQTHDGERTQIEWKSDILTMPTIYLPEDWIPGYKAGTLSPASGAVLLSRGLLQASRGTKKRMPDGKLQRPDLYLLDDVQTDESAASQTQTDARLRVIRKSILRSAGHFDTVACVLNATVIEPDDLVDQLITRPENASWQSERIAMIQEWPTAHDELWMGRYRQIRQSYDPDDASDQERATREATEFYRQNQAAMDAGGKVSWQYCYAPDTEISALQHAYNILIDDGMDTFQAECQQQPVDRTTTAGALTAGKVVQRLNGRPRGQIPAACEYLTAKIDVHDNLLYWLVAGWTGDFTGYVIDYNTYPQQNQNYFTLRDAKHTLGSVCRDAQSKEGAIIAGLVATLDVLTGAEFTREDGVKLSMSSVLVDIGYLPEVVLQAIFQLGRPNVWPSRGRGIRAGDLPISEWKHKPGDRRGHYWSIFRRQNHNCLVCEFDANFWKSQLRDGFIASQGDPQSISIFGSEPAAHRLIADHFSAETPEEKEGRGRRIEEWKARIGRDNHWLDCMAGCMVGASIAGARLPGSVVTRRPQKRVRLSDLQQKKRVGR